MAFLRLTLLAAIILGCSDTHVRDISRSELLAGSDRFGRTWQIDEIEVELGTLIPKTCLTDNFITYYPDGTYEINEGATKCNPDDFPGLIGEWNLDRSQNRLFVTIGDSIQVWDIDETTQSFHQITSLFTEGYRTYSFTLSK